jgi:hypothetical protein
MAAKGGIVRLTDGGRAAFLAAEESGARAVSFDIDVDALEFRHRETWPAKSSPEDDLKAVSGHLQDDEPSLICFWMDPKWVLISHVPEDSSVRKKMIFAQSRVALKTALGSAKFRRIPLGVLV